ncbi:MAG: hypothetical protein LAT57_12525, partial [Balneolales bacterium]|nr:hypothetical protein [Balneolales bacterium]
MKSAILFLLFIALNLFFGCRQSSNLIKDQTPETETNIDYSIIYYIHADSDYLYHNSDGDRIQGSTQALNSAIEVAQAAKSGEVLIYHHRRERKWLGLIPRSSSQLYHFRFGLMVNQINYRHAKNSNAFLSDEIKLTHEFRTLNQGANHRYYLLYFGHEIPIQSSRGYHRSQPDVEVDTQSFANGIRGFLSTDTDVFDIVVLSTCNNGTPTMANHLSSTSKVMLASPQNLHLSHMNSSKMTLLESYPEISPLSLGRSIAEQSFQQLEASVNSTITLALYDLDIVKNYTSSFSQQIDEGNTTTQFFDNIDCADVLNQDIARFEDGVETWFKPAHFGRQASKS